MNSSSTSKRIFGYDLIKALAMFLVVFYHFNMLDFGFQPNTFYVPNINKLFQFFCAAGVPLFFMVNGALTINKETSFKKVTTKIFRIALIAVFWTLILRCGVEVTVLGKEQLSSIRSFLDYYWFLYSLGMAYFVNYMIQILPKWVGKALIIIIFTLTFLNNFIWDIILFVRPNTELPVWGHSGLFTLYGVVYTRIGAYLKKINPKHSICILLIMFGFLLIVFETIVFTNHEGQLFDSVNSAFPTLGALLISCGIFCELKNIKEPFLSSNIIKTVGVNSAGVYIFHFVFVYLIRFHFFKGVLGIPLLPIIIVFILSLSITILCAYLSELIARSPCRALVRL